MNGTLKTVLLTVLTLSALTIAIVELSGVSKTALFNKLEGAGGASAHASAALDDGIDEARAAIAKTNIEFERSSHNFGKIKDGDVVEHVYKFKNTGANPLIIDEVVATCGCTVPSYTKTPVAPGATGEIAISFNSKGRAGNVDKDIYVKSNAQEPSISLNFKAVVTP